MPFQSLYVFICVIIIFPQTNTFQCAIATDGSTTIVAQLYPEDLIQWTTGDGDGGSGGLGGSPAEVGFVSGNFSSFLALSGDPAVVDVEEVANTVMRGLFVFRVEALDAVEGEGCCLIAVLCWVGRFVVVYLWSVLVVVVAPLLATLFVVGYQACLCLLRCCLSLQCT